MHLVKDRAVQTFPSHLNFKTLFKQAKVMRITTTISFACRTVDEVGNSINTLSCLWSLSSG